MNDISKRLAGETDNTVVTIIPIHNNLDQTEELTDQARTKALKAMTFSADRRGRVVDESTVSVKRFDGGSIAGVDLEEREMYALRFAAETGDAKELVRTHEEEWAAMSWSDCLRVELEVLEENLADAFIAYRRAERDVEVARKNLAAALEEEDQA